MSKWISLLWLITACAATGPSPMSADRPFQLTIVCQGDFINQAFIGRTSGQVAGTWAFQGVLVSTARDALVAWQDTTITVTVHALPNDSWQTSRGTLSPANASTWTGPGWCAPGPWQFTQTVLTAQ